MQNKLTLDDLLNAGVQPANTTPHSPNLDAALSAAAKLTAVEVTHLQGVLHTQMEVYRASLTEALLNDKSDRGRGND